MRKIAFIILLTILFTGLTYSKPQRQEYPEYEWDHNRLRNFTQTEHFTQEEIDRVSDVFNGINYHEFTINEDLGDVTSKLIFGRTTGGNGEISYDGSKFATTKDIVISNGNDSRLHFHTGAFVGISSYDDLILSSDPNQGGGGSSIQFFIDNSEKARLTHNGYLLINAIAPIGTEKLRVNGNVYGDGTASLDALILREKSADPADPAEGQSVIWQADGTGAGDDGDLMVKITAGGVTKTTILVDFSAF